MKVPSSIDRLISFNLANGQLFTEDKLICEQRVILVVNNFAYAIKNKSRKELTAIKNKILQDYKENPSKAYFFIHVLRIVDEQLKKLVTG
ncbi:hypothetical protein GXP67_35675 [Rhodocytophaga rosea]|uniref:Uncharacterized protein n=1 Tax=Rhodocytophaga rosea TaxID=2704465 RepID=A0A6C0GVQ3_9BACT|nr:hypothetical protein [Rhodocytophaga rosea]QHT71633.1 hypothetical protein GXP67_35675 [Rhodocytophaga rosea]